MVVESGMRYLFVTLALLLVSCGAGSDPATVQRVDAIVEDCGNAQLQCVTDALINYCQRRYDAGKLTDFESWSECWIDDLAEYCQRPGTGIVTDACMEKGVEAITPESPYWPILEAATDALIDTCDRLHEAGKLATEVARAECIVEGNKKLFRKYRFYSLIEGYKPRAAKRIELAKRIDSGTITREQAEKEWQAFLSEMSADESIKK